MMLILAHVALVKNVHQHFVLCSALHAQKPISLLLCFPCFQPQDKLDAELSDLDMILYVTAFKNGRGETVSAQMGVGGGFQ